MDLTEMEGVVFSKVSKGHVFRRQDEPVTCLYYMVRGVIYRTMTTVKGDEILYGIKSVDAETPLAQSLVGVLALYNRGISRTTFTAMSDCEGYIVPTEVFMTYVKDKPALLDTLLHLAMAEYDNLMNRYQTRQEKQVANELCQILLNRVQPDKTGKFYAEVSNLELAGFLGVHKVTVSRIIRFLREGGVIQRGKQGLQILDVDRLEQYASGEQIHY